MNDPLTVAKLQFFSFLVAVLQPFLKSHQTDEPMVPFLFDDIFSLLQQILQTVVKPDLLINCKDFGDLMKLDLDKRNPFMKLKDMTIGFSIISTITKLKETDQINNAQISSFYNGVIQFVSTIAKKLLTKAQCLAMWSEIQ